mmetsp:Transcript_14202/g.1274  ORF Transcript_14202/g.1274 Transcript_14202/m.1274 type:complete len:101 (-) Transcript_14202:185-487(-)
MVGVSALIVKANVVILEDVPITASAKALNLAIAAFKLSAVKALSLISISIATAASKAVKSKLVGSPKAVAVDKSKVNPVAKPLFAIKPTQVASSSKVVPA